MSIECGLFDHGRRRWFDLGKGNWSEDVDFTSASSVADALGRSSFKLGRAIEDKAVARIVSAAVVRFASPGVEYVESWDHTRYYEYANDYTVVGDVHEAIRRASLEASEQS